MGDTLVMDAVEVEAVVEAANAVVMDSLVAEYDTMTDAAALVMDAVEVEANLSSAADVAELAYVTSTILADKDSWVPSAKTAGTCNDNTNKNGTDLRVGDVVLTNTPHTIFGFDVSGFPTGATVTAATLTLAIKTAPTTSQSYSAATIASANEGWAEATVTCSNLPAGTNLQTFNTGTTVGDITVTLTAAHRTQLAARMGVGSFSMKIEPDLSDLETTFQSKDEGTDNSSGPRLAFTFTVPV